MKRLTTSLAAALVSLFTLAAGPVHDRTEVRYLSGTGSDDTVQWDFFCSGGAASGRWEKIAVPSQWELQGFGEYTYGRYYYNKPDAVPSTETGLYRYDFEVPASWKGREVDIVFDGVMTDALVKINGKPAGEVHRGAFYRFDYRITKLLRYGRTNQLEVLVKKHSDDASVNNAERRADWWLFGGIYRPVWLRSMPASHIGQVSLDPRADGSLRADIATEKAPKGASFRYVLSDLQGKALGERTLSAAAEQQMQWEGVSPWECEHPHLYNLEISLLDSRGAVLHTVSERIGFRTVELRPRDGLYVNGTKVVLKGVNRHCFHPETGRTTSWAVDLEDARLIRQMNMNAVRSHYPPDERFLDICDSLGIFYLDELAGWHGRYSTETGSKLVGEMVARDVNHPSVIIWNNGNEGGWNTELDHIFGDLDPQKRHVIHPWADFDELDTHHYPAFLTGVHRFTNGFRVFMPTEFLHANCDEGAGAGLEDFWASYTSHPMFAGGFIWAFVDENVVRVDKGGILDSYSNMGNDGILGPYREKEGSFWAVRNIWCPVQIEPFFITPSFDGKITVKNSYLFTDLADCSLAWRVLSAPAPGEDGSQRILHSGTAAFPPTAPGLSSRVDLGISDAVFDGDILELEAFSPTGESLCTWSWPVRFADGYLAAHSILSDGGLEVEFDPATGTPSRIVKHGRTVPLTNFRPVGMKWKFKSAYETVEDGNRVYVAKYSGGVDSVKWTVTPDGRLGMEAVVLNRENGGGGFDDAWMDPNVLYLGFTFDYPEEGISGMDWLGRGPYRVWKNRIRGHEFGLWSKACNNTVTGQTSLPHEHQQYPEFKGYHANVYWAALRSASHPLTIRSATDGLFLRVFTPEQPQGLNSNPVFPEGDISLLLDIPAIKSFKPVSQHGPHSQPGNVRIKSGDEGLGISVWFDFPSAPAGEAIYAKDFDTRSQKPFEVNVPVPDGNYLVTLTLGDPAREARTTVKAESRRLCLMQEATAAGETKTVSFLVNKRDSHIRKDGKTVSEVRLKPREQGKLDWDDVLTLEILGDPAVSSIVITPAGSDVVTVYLCGDSTVVDQDNEPWASWGQMFPYFTDEKVSIANYAESGERADSFIAEGRLDKVLSLARPGDYVMVEFGHNDMKLTGPDKNGFGFFADQLRIFVDRIREKGAVPVLVTPTHRRNFDADGHIIETHADYPDGMRHVAASTGTGLIELHDMSGAFYESLGPEGSKSAFVHYPAGAYPGMPSDVADNTHFNPFGAFELARRVARAVQGQIPGLAGHIRRTNASFDWQDSPYRDLAAQVAEEDDMPFQALPDSSLSRHPFAYVGEYDTRNPDRQTLHIVRDGKSVFQYSIPLHDSLGRINEFDDVRVLDNGEIVYAAMSQVGVLGPDGREIWKFICPQGTESHSCQPLDRDHVYFALNGVPGKILIWNYREDKLVKEIIVPTAGTSTHGQFRHVRMTREGHFVMGLIHEQTVAEIDSEGKLLMSIPGQKAWHVDKLDNGGYLIGGDNRGYVREFDKDGKLVWEYTREDAPFPIYNLQTATRLSNGNTLITSWVAGQPKEVWPGSVQFFEVSPDKQVVWKVSSWEDPDLGPCTYIDLLDEPRRKRARRLDGSPAMMNDRENVPLGEGKGIHPGRVSWVHDPSVAVWDGETGYWWEERWNDQAAADRMIAEGVMKLAGENTPKKAWTALFTHFNETHGRGRHPYRKGEKIAIKLNMNNTFSYTDNEELNSSPYVTLALLRSLVADGGVRQEDITVCEPSRWLTDALYLRCKKYYPRVHYVDNVGEEGREKCIFVDGAMPFTAGHGENQKGLAQCIVDADYVINSALLKIHKGPGVTLTGKNWYGATSLDKDWHKNSHNSVSPDKRYGTPKYSSFVDFIGHKDLGGKCLLYLIDGSYGSRDVNGKPAPKWQRPPFNGAWACSLLLSQDPLAVDSVGQDLLSMEWPEIDALSFSDSYLVEAATIPHSPSGVLYDPEQDGTPLDAPLGLQEHCDRSGKYIAIDLIYTKL